jgi:two-component system, OmpR family, sensor histidine kinase BaeS
MSRRLIFTLFALVAATVVLAELLLHPAPGDRGQLLLILIAPAVVAGTLTPLLARWVSSRASFAGVALAVGLCSLALGAVTSSAASNAMFVSSHDYRLFLVVLLLSSGISLAVASQLTRPITRDVRRLGEVATLVAGGDLSVRTGVVRRDEIGATARALDQMIEALRTAETERAQLSAARQHFFTSIGHDLRTPLSAMRAAVEGLEDGIAPDPLRYLSVLGSQLRTLDGMLEQMIEFSRLESGHRSTDVMRISLTELTDECVEALSPLAHQHSIALTVDADGPAHLTASPFELSRVIRNLTDNAIRHSPDGHPVTIRIRTGVDTLRLSVTDEGAGFPADFRELAFEPFHRADPSRNARTGNSGLGLAICRAIVTGHRGRMWIGDGPGGRVEIELPLATPHDMSGATP